MRINKIIAQSIATNAVNDTFDDRKKELKDREAKLGMEGYETMFSEAVRKQAAAMPKEWIRQDACLRFNAGGYNLLFNVPEPVPVPIHTRPYGYGGSCNKLADIPHGDLCDRMQKWAQDCKTLTDEINQANRSVMNLVTRFSSIKRLKEAWPEGYEFYKAYEGEPVKVPLPALRIDELNKVLGLPKKPDEEAALAESDKPA